MDPDSNPVVLPEQPKHLAHHVRYPDYANPELLEKIPLNARTVLDVGCAQGALGEAYLRRNPSARVLGIDIDVESIPHAATRLTEVVCADVEADPMPFAVPDGIDCIIYGDVLEHMKDPWTLLQRHVEYLAPGGTVLVCMPNVEHWSLVLRLLQGNFDYEDMGLLDRTHLRWFTPRTMAAALSAAGLELATKLGDTLGKSGQARITLVDRSRTHIWKPLLHSVAAGSLRRSQHELNYLAQAQWRHFDFTLGEVNGLDRTTKSLGVGAVVDEEGREITPPRSIPYDTLVMAIGSVTNDFGTPGAARYAIPLETPEQAARFNRRLVNACLRANSQPGPVRPGQLHVAIIGAGATGTELAALL
ncbi:MAG: hypothetical protein B7Z81_08450, partial [Acidocella sp. 20-61-6]